MTMICCDKVLINDWHAVADTLIFEHRDSLETLLLSRRIRISFTPSFGTAPLGAAANRTPVILDCLSGRRLHAEVRYGFVWCCPGQPGRGVVAIPEASESDRITVSGGSIGVGVSGLRVVENFLDLGHLPFVHTGWLGEEPHTEVPPYRVRVNSRNEVHATECRVYQPLASPAATGGGMVAYEYKVLRPYIVSLYKTNPAHPQRMDYIALFIQAAGPERCIVHPFLSYIEDGMTRASLRRFMQLIFAQDKPILENQIPKRLPLDPRAETPIRADKVAIAYRRWLQDQNVTYGAIPAT